jgi:glycosyltransferase involved in cell wall biosynthesis
MSELKDKYNIVPVVLLKTDGPIRNYLDNNGIKYHILPFFWWLFSEDDNEGKLKNAIKQLRNIWRSVVIFRNIRKENIQCIYTNSFTVNIGIVLKRFFHCPHIWHIRESLEQFNFKFALGNNFSRFMLKKGANRYILISDYLVHYYRHILPPEKVTRIYNGIDSKSQDSGIKTYNGQIHLGLLGINNEQKNQMDAIQALDILINIRNKKNLKLHIAGVSNPEYLRRLNEYSNNKKLDTNIMFYGHLNNTRPFFQSVHLGLMCSKGEPFGRVTIEFMMNNIPVIASNSGANPELMKEGVTGFLYQINNTSDLADKIEMFISNPELLKQIGASAAEYARKNFSSERNTYEVYQIIHNEMESFYH